MLFFLTGRSSSTLYTPERIYEVTPHTDDYAAERKVAVSARPDPVREHWNQVARQAARSEGGSRMPPASEIRVLHAALHVLDHLQAVVHHLSVREGFEVLHVRLIHSVYILLMVTHRVRSYDRSLHKKTLLVVRKLAISLLGFLPRIVVLILDRGLVVVSERVLFVMKTRRCRNIHYGCGRTSPFPQASSPACSLLCVSWVCCPRSHLQTRRHPRSCHPSFDSPSVLKKRDSFRVIRPLFLLVL